MPNRVALITAGSAGLGAQIARVLAPDFRVCVNYMNNASRANALVEELNANYGCDARTGDTAGQPRFFALKADASNKAPINGMVETVIAIFGRLDVVASNSGWTRITSFSDIEDNMDDDLWDRTYRCNVKAHFWLMHAVEPYLRATKGSFVTTASLAGVKPGGSSLPYAISKAAQIHLVKTLSEVCAPNIRINSVSPSLMLTDWGLQFDEKDQLAQAERNRLKRLVTVQDTANVVQMLLLNESMTGQNVVVDCKPTPDTKLDESFVNTT
ncbi:NAD(P)-binding protein [Aureobasidium sp. EXF-8845]|nr:NAD(P)-binding protein [Aureobasidium sp. EXF-8846]KAI4808043.1 NAD(P)-binding protein [Aureobasidium sp. EXF-8845]